MAERMMKDSGIRELGTIPAEWETRKLKYICSSKITNISTELIKESGRFKVFGAAGLMGYIDTKEMDQEYIGIVKDGAGAGRMDFYPADSSLLGTMAYIMPNNSTNLKWLMYVISSLNLGESVDKTTIPHIYFSEYGNNFVCYPSYNEQARIADFLDKKVSEIDAVISKTKESIEEYKKLKQSIVTEAVTKGLDPNAEVRDSGIEWIGSIPKTWDKIKITRILDYSVDYPIGDGDHGLIGPGDYIEEGIPYIRVQNLGWGTKLDLSNIVFISEENNRKISKSILKPNDVLFAKTGATIGKTGIVPYEVPISNTTSHVGKITVSHKINARYVFYFLSSFVGYRQFWEIAIMKTTRPELANDEVKTMFVLLPKSHEEQDSIVEYLDVQCSKYDILISKKEQVITELEQYKKSLIYEYVTGKKEVA